MKTLHRRTYILLVLANFGFLFGVGMYLGIQPLFFRTLGANSLIIGLLYTIFFITTSIATLLGGFLSDRLNKKWILILSFVITIPAPIIYIFANHWIYAIPGLILEGLSFIGWPVVDTYVASITPAEHRGYYFTLFYAMTGIGFVPAPLIGGWIVSAYGYSTMYFWATIAFLVGLLFSLPISHLKRSDEEMGFLMILQNRSLWGFILLTAIMFGGFSLVSSYASLFMQDVHNLTESGIGLLGTVGSLTATILGPIIGRAGDSIGKEKILTLPVLGFFSAYFILIIIPTAHLLVIYNLVLALFSSYWGLMSSCVIEQLPIGDQGKGLGMYQLIGQVSRAITPIFGGQLYTIDVRLPFLLLQILLIPSIILIVFSFKTKKKPVL